jgi:hypothetical protein
MHNIILDIETVYDSKPCFLEILSNQKIIFKGEISKNLKIEFKYPRKNFFELKIKKTGKTLDIVKLKHRQEVYIKSLLLNGFSLHPDKFAKFESKDNPYVKNSIIQTNILTLNGVWTINLPLFDISGISTLMTTEFRDTVEDCDIACFGCSFTAGNHIDYKETYPFLLSKALNKKVCNYGIGGSNNQEIFANAIEYSKNFRCKKMILLLCHSSRLQIENEETKELLNWYLNMPNLKFETQKVKEITRQVVLHGESSVLLSSQIPQIIKNLSIIEKNINGKVYIGFYIPEEYFLFSNIGYFKNKLLPLFELNKRFPLADDNKHPGPLHYQAWTDKIIPILNDDQN